MKERRNLSSRVESDKQEKEEQERYFANPEFLNISSLNMSFDLKLNLIEIVLRKTFTLC